MITTQKTARLPKRAQVMRWMAAAMLPIAVVACSTEELLKANYPDQISPDGLSTSLQGASALYAGAIGDFTVAFSGSAAGGFGQVMTTGFMTDEFAFGGTPPEIRQFDLRSVDASNGLGASTYNSLHSAREAAVRAAGVFKAIAPTDPRGGEMKALEAMLIVLMGENYCSGAPISTTTPTITYGPSLTTVQALTLAVSTADAALALAGADAQVKSLAAVTKARAQLDLGQHAAAAATVAAVPTSFVYYVKHGTATERQKSITFTYGYNSHAFLVSNKEGINGLDFATAKDPRLPVDGSGAVSDFDFVTPMYFFAKYNSQDHAVVVSSGVEARLIEAEAALNASNPALWLSKLTEARVPYSMAAPVDPGTAAGRVDFMFRERAFTMFATAHRMGDLRRLVRQYGRDSEKVWPTGAYHKNGLTRGTDQNMVVPATEKNNPNFTACINRGA